LKHPFQREQAAVLSERLAEPRRFLQVVTGSRQVGKTTLVTQVTDGLRLPVRFVSADEPTLLDRSWLRQQWEAARVEAAKSGRIFVFRRLSRSRALAQGSAALAKLPYG